MTHSRATLTVGCLVLATFGMTSLGSPASGAEPEPVVVEMAQVSTPDSAFGLGRTLQPAFVNAEIERAEYEADGTWMTGGDTGEYILEVLAAPSTLDSGTPVAQMFGAHWYVLVDPGLLEVGTTQESTLRTHAFSLVLEDANYLIWPDGHCHDADMTYTVHEVSVGADGKPEALAVSYKVMCGPGDTTWGSFAFNTDVQPLPDEAMAVAAADLAYPHPSGTSGPDVRDFAGARVVGDDLETAWGQESGFACALVDVIPERGGGESLEYIGGDDTHTFTGLDTARNYEIDVHLSWGLEFPETSCHDSPDIQSFDSFNILSGSVDVASVATSPVGPSVQVKGAVTVTPGVVMESDPLRSAPVQLWRDLDGVETLIGETTTTTDNGEFTFTVPNWRTKTVWVELPHRDPSADDPVGWFDGTSAKVTLSAQHIVTASIADARAPRDSAVMVKAIQHPRGEPSTLELQRQNDAGDWVIIDSAVTAPHTATELRLPSVRAGWQRLRVVAPADDRHERGASDAIRLYGR